MTNRPFLISVDGGTLRFFIFYMFIFNLIIKYNN